MNGRRPRLAILGFSAERGGFGRVMVNLLTGFDRLGVELDLLLPRGAHPDLEDVTIKLNRFPLDFDSTERPAIQLGGYLAERLPDAILSNKDQTSTLLAEHTTVGSRPFTVFRIGTNVLEKLRRGSFWSRSLKKSRLASVYRQADALIGNSAGVSRALQVLLGDVTNPPVFTIWNPVDLQRIRQMSRTSPDHPWFASRDLPLLVSVGRLVAAKDYETLLRAFVVVRRQLECRLVIFGEGGKRDRLLRLAGQLGVQEHFDLPGFTANPFAYVARADAFVLSSIFEGASNSLMEALALGTPCVSTDCPSGPREILADGQYGPLVPVGDVLAMAKAIRCVLENPPGRVELAQAAERFDLQTSTRRYVQVLGLKVLDGEERGETS